MKPPDYQLKLAAWKEKLKGDRSFIKMCHAKIRELEDNILNSAQDIDAIYRRYATCIDGDKKSWQMWLITREKERKKEVEKKLTSWQIKLQIVKGTWTGKKLNVSQAKLVPIGDLMPTGPQFHSVQREFFVCPFHEEKNASLCWYKKTNTWWCHGCQSGSDSIDFIMKFNNCDFKTAVEILCKY